MAFTTDSAGVVAGHLRRWTAGPVAAVDPRPPPDTSCHQSEPLLRARTLLHGPASHTVPQVPPAALEGVAAPAPRSAPGAARILLHPGSGARRKCWPPDRYAQLATALGASGAWTGFVCGPAESGIEAHLPGPVMRPASPLQLAACLRTADLFIGNDSGPAHLAAAVGTRTLALFGPTDPVVWRPLAPWAQAVRAPAGDLERLTVDSVVQLAHRLLATPTPTRF